MKHTNHSLNIIYLNITEKGPSGGKKTIYYYSNLINKLTIPNVTSEILHIKKKKFSLQMVPSARLELALPNGQGF